MTPKFCRACRLRSDESELDARSVCAGCAAKLAAGWRPNEAYCVQCGSGPGHAHAFDEKGVCLRCHQARRAGTVPGPFAPTTRPNVPCLRCEGRSLVRVALRERGTWGGDDARERVVGMALTFEIGQGSRPDSQRPIGTLEAYVCRACGFTELYTRDAASIPIGEAYGTEAIEIASDGPFR
jgi:hypothetical protein